jgi:hypothetical protein
LAEGGQAAMAQQAMQKVNQQLLTEKEIAVLNPQF